MTPLRLCHSPIPNTYPEMLSPRRILQLSFLAALVIIVACLQLLSNPATPDGKTTGANRLAEGIDASTPRAHNHPSDVLASTDLALSIPFRSGLPKPRGDSYTRHMVIPRMKEDNLSWIAIELPGTSLTIYTADEPTAPDHPPRNKGHEVMIYLTYIIEHYRRLPDIILFMHSHRFTHHNNEILGYDAGEMVRRLSNEHVTRAGYVNMRCNWDPGCPEWLHRNPTKAALNKQEEEVLSECWEEFFPQHPVPEALGQTCCAQFALSKERIHSIPLSRFIFFRDWILRTPLVDYISGRIWEYSWQFLLTGESVVCPAEHVCYCDGFGLCFGGEAGYRDFVLLWRTKQDYELEIKGHRAQNAPSTSSIETLDPDRLSYLEYQVGALDRELAARKQEAIERGNVPQIRAEECGRMWKDGDGF